MSEKQQGPGSDAVQGRLAESEQRYRDVIENASDMIQSCRPDGSFEFVNKAWLEKMGYTKDEVEKLIIWDVIHPDSRPHCQELFTRAMQGETIEDARADFVTKDGERVPLEGNATSRFVNGEIIATHSFFRDISEKLRSASLEAENLRLEQEQKARYLEKMAALGKLSAGLAHELNNPSSAARRAADQLAETSERLEQSLAELHSMGLTPQQWAALYGYVASAPRTPPAGRPTEVSRREGEMEDWLADHNVEDAWELAAALVHDGYETESLEALAAVVPEPALRPVLTWLAESGAVRELTDVVTRSTQRIADLVAAVKSYSFMDRATDQEVDIHEGIENTLVILGHRLRNLTVHRHFDHSLPLVRTQGSSLNQVWTNILDNAIDAAGEGGVITIRTGRSGERLMVEIEDSGPGIPPENLTRVFEPFFSTKPQGEGTGLGLEIVWRIITQDHGGSVEAESQPGRTVFRVLLPVA